MRARARSKARFAPGSRHDLAFGELEPLAGALLPVLFPLALSGVASEVAEFLEPRPQFRVELNQSAGQSHPHGAGLSVDAAAMGENQHVEFVRGLGGQ